jgi:hypothetical protein
MSHTTNSSKKKTKKKKPIEKLQQPSNLKHVTSPEACDIVTPVSFAHDEFMTQDISAPPLDTFLIAGAGVTPQWRAGPPQHLSALYRTEQAG